NCFIIVQDVMLLVIVSNRYFRPQGKGAAVSPDNLIKYLEKRGFSGAVVPDYGNVLTTFYFKINILKQNLIVKAFGEMLHSQNIIAAYAGRLKSEVHLAHCFGRFVNGSHFFKHLLPAFSSSYGFFPIK